MILIRYFHQRWERLWLLKVIGGPHLFIGSRAIVNYTNVLVELCTIPWLQQKYRQTSVNVEFAFKPNEINSAIKK